MSSLDFMCGRLGHTSGFGAWCASQIYTGGPRDWKMLVKCPALLTGRVPSPSNVL